MRAPGRRLVAEGGKLNTRQPGRHHPHVQPHQQPDGFHRLTNMQKIVRAQMRQENAESQSQVYRTR
jgi:hypothetical protein